ncbi:DNA translocase FtsK [Marinospirillum insulare]|uniref:DNA translocase FtsK n=1 Tax=Marinospirillum insulare TaxID=217169 RepID=A0ABQ5ZUJ5_9GAMM|nr:DNA translocase FtsK [Marinospirillum insulare]GLR63116.1 DNA translocase FtsK [Marinospirillum insulare]
MSEQLNLSDKLRKALKETAILLLLLISLMLLIALFSFNPNDPGWNGATQEIPSNLMGLFGSWLADLLFSLTGIAAWLFPLALVHLSIQLVRRPWEKAGWDPYIPSLRFFGFVLLLIGVSASAAGHALAAHLPYGAGGILGESLANLINPVLGHLGASLIFISGVVAGLSLITGWSWLVVMDEIGNILLRLVKVISSKLSKPKISFKWLPNLKERLPSLPSPTSQPKSSEIAKEEPRLGDLTSGEGTPEIEKTSFETEEKTPKLMTLQDLQPEGNKQDAASLVGEKPGLELLDEPQAQQVGFTSSELEDLAALIQQNLKDYGVKAEVVGLHPGPVITQFELELAAGVKSSRVAGLALDLARALKVTSIRVVEVIAGQSTIGIEIPNKKRALIYLKEVLDYPVFLEDKHPLPLALGQDIAGNPLVVNLAKMPHLLVAGTTGSGKSVGVNAMILSMLLQRSPEELRLIMIDPKMLELSVYEGIPHLLAPVVTDMKEAANSLRWCVAEMERRYQLMSAMGVRNLVGYNQKLAEAAKQGAQVVDPIKEVLPGEQPTYLEQLPYVVVVIDEFADMMMLVGKKVEELIARLAQKARAAGIHLILATQRPSVDVITGLIKANIPTRIGFQVSSKIDSRTILDQSGAEQLLGNGDLLYMPTGAPQPIRVHGAFVSDDEVHRVVENWKLRGEPDYEDAILNGKVDAQALAGLEAEGTEGSAEQDELYDEAVAFVIESRRASASAIQRRFKVGYNRAAGLIEGMEQAGLVSPLQSNGQRELLLPE